MGLLSDFARRLKGHNCEMLVKRTANEITISGPSIGIGDIKVDIGSFSNKVLELVKATEVAVALDNSQYLLCKEVSNMKDNDSLKGEYKKIRLQLIMAFNQLQGILGSIRGDGTKEQKKELADWIRYMNELHKQSISLVGPAPKFVSKGGKSKLRQIRKYQGIDENELQAALAEM
jgi:hypothetical protein